MSIKPENKWPDTDIVLHKKCKVSFVTDIPVMSGATIVINILNHTSKKFVDGAKFASNLQFLLITQKTSGTRLCPSSHVTMRLLVA